MDNLNPDTALALLKATQSQVTQSGKAVKNATKSAEDAKLDTVAEDFEAMFISEMMKPMFEGIKPDPMFGGGKAEEVFNGMMLSEYGKLMAQTGQLGIAEAVKTEMIRLQEEADHGTQEADISTDG